MRDCFVEFDPRIMIHPRSRSKRLRTEIAEFSLRPARAVSFIASAVAFCSAPAGRSRIHLGWYTGRESGDCTNYNSIS